jgi:hypothetical protein
MATTTPNFGWSVPTSTDLVKDGATAIETLGDAIDASLLDLKGGTSGQVLSKNSNTDMDFIWVTSDDANAIQNTIVDAKGDLIGATASDTPARLAVGTNGQVLTADSTAGTGLKWATPAGSGLVHLNTTTGSGVTSISIGSDASPLFSSTYDHYKIVIVCDSDSTASQVNFRLRANTTDLTGANYNTQTVGGASTTAFAQQTLAGTSAKVMDNHTTDYTNSTEFLLTNPFNARNKTFLSNSVSTRNTIGTLVNNGYIDSASSYNGITILSSDNINNATIYVYGLAK